MNGTKDMRGVLTLREAGLQLLWCACTLMVSIGQELKQACCKAGLNAAESSTCL